MHNMVTHAQGHWLLLRVIQPKRIAIFQKNSFWIVFQSVNVSRLLDFFLTGYLSFPHIDHNCILNSESKGFFLPSEQNIISNKKCYKLEWNTPNPKKIEWGEWNWWICNDAECNTYQNTLLIENTWHLLTTSFWHENYRTVNVLQLTQIVINPKTFYPQKYSVCSKLVKSIF